MKIYSIPNYNTNYKANKKLPPQTLLPKNWVDFLKVDMSTAVNNPSPPAHMPAPVELGEKLKKYFDEVLGVNWFYNVKELKLPNGTKLRSKEIM